MNYSTLMVHSLRTVICLISNNLNVMNFHTPVVVNVKVDSMTVLKRIFCVTISTDVALRVLIAMECT